MSDPTTTPADSSANGDSADPAELYRLMQVVDVERYRRTMALEVLSVGDQKERLRKELVKLYAEEGTPVTEGEINTAIESYYSDRHQFKPPVRNLGYYSALFYIRRLWVFSLVIVPLFIAGIAAWMIHSASLTHERVRRQQEELRVEGGVEQLYQAALKSKAEFELVSADLARQQDLLREPGRSQAAEQAALARERLKSLDEFFLTYCPRGAAREVVTAENYDAVERGLPAQRNALDEAARATASVAGFVRQAGAVAAAGRSLDALIQDLRAPGVAKVIGAAAEVAYERGVTAVDRFDLAAAQSGVSELTRLRQDAAQLRGYETRARQLDAAISSVAREPGVAGRGKALEAQFRAAAEAGDVETASRRVNQMQDLRTTLEEVFTLRIVDGPGVKSGVSRAPRGNRTQNYYYLIVEAVTPENKVLTRNIVNEENQRSERATRWAERVPQSLYEQVKQEKMRIGRVEDRKLMTKEAGYVTEKPGRLDKRQGQITRWND